MKNTSTWQPLFHHAGSALLVLGVAALTVNAEEFCRKGRFDLFASGQYVSGDNTMLAQGPFSVGLKYDGFYGAGLGVGYNLTDHLNLNLDWTFGVIDSKAGTIRVDTDAFAMNFTLGLDYNLVKSRFTPLLTAGLGYSYFADHFTVGPVQWDYQQATLTMGGGAGLRWDFSEHVFVKGVYRLNWHTGLDAIKQDMVFHELTVMLGYSF